MEKSLNCPVCGRFNTCQAGEEFCWCMNEKFPQEMLEAVDRAHGKKECICTACLKDYKADPEKFLKDNGLR